jgi:hypothetical protein
MNRLPPLVRAFSPCAALAFLVLSAAPAAAAPDRRLDASRLEDRLIDGEIDPEDFLRWHLAPGAILDAGRGAAYVGIEAFAVERTNAPAELGAMLVLEVPLDRFWMRGAARVANVGLFGTSPRAPADPAALAVGSFADVGPGTDTRGLGVAGQVLPGGAKGAGRPRDPQLRASAHDPTPHEAPVSPAIAQNAVARAERPLLPPLTVTAEVARSCVRAALRAVGLSDDQRLDSVASRARSSAALPELRFRAVRTLGESGRISLSDDDPSRYVASGAASNVLEARLTFRLDRLLFADEEIAVERARLDRSELRSRIAAKVLQALFEWQKAFATAADATLPAEERWNAALREAEACAILDMMTGGWFGSFRAALAARGM